MKLKYKPSNDSLIKLITRIPDDIGSFTSLLKPILDKKALPENHSEEDFFAKLIDPEKLFKIAPYLKKIDEIKEQIKLWLVNGVMPFTMLKYGGFGIGAPEIKLREYEEMVKLYDILGIVRTDEMFLFKYGHFLTRGGRFSKIYIDNVTGEGFKNIRDKVIPEALANRYELQYISIDFGDSHSYHDHYYDSIEFSRSLWASPEGIELTVSENLERKKTPENLAEEIDKEMFEIGAVRIK